MRREREQPVTECVVYAYECDGCGKVVEVTPGRRADPPEGWAWFDSHHSDWGNDSVETYENHDVCSWACYVKVMRAIVDDYSVRYGRPTLQADGRDWKFLTDMLASYENQER